MVDKIALTGPEKQETPAQSTDSQVAVDYTKCRTEENVDLVNDLVQSQENTPQTHRTVHEIARETGIWLRCYEITTMSLVAAFYWNTVYMQKMQQM